MSNVMGANVMGANAVGLDLSLTGTGVARADGTVAVIKTNPHAYPHPMERINAIMSQAFDHILGTDELPDLVVIEGYSYGSQSSQAHSIGQLGGVIKHELWKDRVPVAIVPPSNLKKYATGRGNADKVAMIIAARERLSYDGQENNEADALWLRQIGLHRLGDVRAVPLPQTHLAALQKVEWPADLVDLHPAPPVPNEISETKETAA